MPDGIVSRLYQHQVLVNGGANVAPTTYSAKNLPPGITINRLTGLISGRPTRPGTYQVSLTVSNGISPTSTLVIPEEVQIIAMPVGLDGAYSGLVARQTNLNGDAGGRLDVTVTTLGTFSGTLVMGATPYRFKGNIELGLTPGTPPVAAAPFSASVVIPRSNTLAPMVLIFTIDEVTRNHFSSAQISSETVVGPVSAAVNAWKITTNIPAYVGGPYNFGLRLPITVNSDPNPNINNAAVPQGDGYASFTVSAKGTLVIAGKTADGEKITCATYVGRGGEVLFYQSLYATVRKGSVCGQLTIGPGLDPGVTDNVITSSAPFDWTRPPATAVLGTATNTRTYRAGFGLAGTPVTSPVELEAFGGFYIAPTHLLQVAAPSISVDNANLTFTGASVDLPTREPDLSQLAINLAAIKILTPSTALTKISGVLRTGAFSGSFALADDDTTTTTPPALLNKADEIKRAVTFQGLIVPEAGNHRGVGYFMLPQIPPATALAKTANILSGKVNFDN